jgi:hypothetical protein
MRPVTLDYGVLRKAGIERLADTLAANLLIARLRGELHWFLPKSVRRFARTVRAAQRERLRQVSANDLSRS